MKEIIDYFSESGSILSFVVAITIIVAIIKVGEKVFSWCSNKLTAYYNIRRGKDKQKETVDSYDKRITAVEDKLDSILNKVDSVVSSFKDYEERQKSVNTVLLRDKLNYIYKDCLRKGYILEKEKQDFTYAFDEYVKNGGNSYIINEVKPYIHNLKVYLNDEDAIKNK